MEAGNTNEVMVAPMLGSGGVCLAGVWSQAVGFVLVRLAEICFKSSWRCFRIS